MNCQATLRTESKDAAAVAESLRPDNVGMDSLSVSSRADGGFVVSEVRSRSVGTLLATVDDILRCQMASESLI
jgi:hypothetical protein